MKVKHYFNYRFVKNVIKLESFFFFSLPPNPFLLLICKTTHNTQKPETEMVKMVLEWDGEEEEDDGYI